MKVSITANTNGKGKFSSEARAVTINRINFGYKSTEYYPEDPPFGELRAWFNPYGFVPGSWNVEGFGFICTDKLWLREFKAGLKELGFSTKALHAMSYGEHSLQGDDYVSLDVKPAFFASWERLVKLGKLKSN